MTQILRKLMSAACAAALAAGMAVASPPTSQAVGPPTGSQGKPSKLSSKSPPEPLQVTVTQVLAGDSLVLTPPGQAPVTVRLRDIEAPAPCQVHGAESRLALADMALNKPAVWLPVGRAGQGPAVGSVRVADQDLSVRQVEEGHAWSLRVRNDEGPLVKQERMARALGRGLHAAGGAMKPWDFRSAHGPCN
jgi:endonuclease YncB( thermonuclease family)